MTITLPNQVSRFRALHRSLAATVAALSLAGLLLAGCSTPPPTSESEASGWPGTTLNPDKDQIEIGHRVAMQQCSRCHSIDTWSMSTDRAAPPLREVLFTNDPDFIAYRFIDAMRVGHDEMPLFDFDVRSADALVAFIKSISGR